MIDTERLVFWLVLTQFAKAVFFASIIVVPVWLWWRNDWLVSLPGWAVKFHPQLKQRATSLVAICYWGLLPNGQEWLLPTTLTEDTNKACKVYRKLLRRFGVRFIGPIKIIRL